MKKIALISDTHSYLADDVIEHLLLHDEIWHAGDVGSIDVIDKLNKLGKTIRGVYGNIDDRDVRAVFPENQIFDLEGAKVFMTHIGGYPGKYTSRVKRELLMDVYQLYICGHSHVLKVMYDDKIEVLHMNPGACGVHGFHKFRTILSFELSKGKVENLKVIELGLRSKIGAGQLTPTLA